MHECFEKDKWITIDYTDVCRIWWQISEEKLKKNEMVVSERLTLSKLKQLESWDGSVLVLDNRCNVLTSYEVRDALTAWN
jgi:hypothetical protein